MWNPLISLNVIKSINAINSSPIHVHNLVDLTVISWQAENKTGMEINNKNQ